MKKFIYSTLTLALLASCQSINKESYNIDSVASPKGTEVFHPDWKNIADNYQFPEWFADAKFGIFIHWGPYSVPAYDTEWYSRNMYQKDHHVYKHHIETWGPQDKFGYKDFIPLFKAEKFNAEEWVKLFKEAGAKYIVPVAEHHDGFSMYNSKLNKWNAVNMGPKKDIIGLLKEAIEKEGLIFGLSTHRAENAWFYNGGMKFPSDVQDSTISLYGRRYDNEKYTEDFAREWLTHTYELINKYEPKLIWFDWTVNNPVLMPYFNKFMAYYYNNALDWGKNVVVNTKYGYPTNVQVWDIERGKSGKMMQFPWQTDTSVGKKSWSYIDGEENKSPEQIVHDLIDIVSKNGNLLLNIGPRADGTITDEQKAVLLSIGKWLKVNGEAIYDTYKWKQSEQWSEGDRNWKDKGKHYVGGNSILKQTVDPDPGFAVKEAFFTAKNNAVYAILPKFPENQVILKDIRTSSKTKITLLGYDKTLKWKQNGNNIVIEIPTIPYSKVPCQYAWTLKLEYVE